MTYDEAVKIIKKSIKEVQLFDTRAYYVDYNEERNTIYCCAVDHPEKLEGDHILFYNKPALHCSLLRYPEAWRVYFDIDISRVGLPGLAGFNGL